MKADVYQNLVTFTRVPPKEAVAETVALILDVNSVVRTHASHVLARYAA